MPVRFERDLPAPDLNPELENISDQSRALFEPHHDPDLPYHFYGHPWDSVFPAFMYLAGEARKAGQPVDEALGILVRDTHDSFFGEPFPDIRFRSRELRSALKSIDKLNHTDEGEKLVADIQDYRERTGFLDPKITDKEMRKADLAGENLDAVIATASETPIHTPTQLAFVVSDLYTVGDTRPRMLRWSAPLFLEYNMLARLNGQKEKVWPVFISDQKDYLGGFFKKFTDRVIATSFDPDRLEQWITDSHSNMGSMTEPDAINMYEYLAHYQDGIREILTENQFKEFARLAMK